MSGRTGDPAGGRDVVVASKVASHRASLSRLSAAGGPLSPDAPTATVHDRRWFSEDGARPGRKVLHERLLDEHRAEQPRVAQERRAVILAGPPGAGKSTVLRKALGDDVDTFLRVDPDEFKGKLLQQAVADGSLDSIKPAEVRALEATGEKFFPMDLAALVHEESSMLAAKARARAMADGDNLVVDGVLSNPQKALALARELEARGYRIHVIDVEVPADVSLRSIEQRWEQDHVGALEGRNDHGGRYVPEPVVREVFDGPGGTSKPQHSAERVAHAVPAVERYQVFRAQSADADRTLQVDMHRLRADGRLTPTGGRPGAVTTRTRHGAAVRPTHARGD